MLKIPVPPTFKGTVTLFPFLSPHMCFMCKWWWRFAACSRWRWGGGGLLPRRSAKKNNSKRSTILQHLLAEPHQQMLQNSSALEIKGGVVRRGCERMTDHCRNGDTISKLQPGTHCIWEGGKMESVAYFLLLTDIIDVINMTFQDLCFDSKITEVFIRPCA